MLTFINKGKRSQGLQTGRVEVGFEARPGGMVTFTNMGKLTKLRIANGFGVKPRGMFTFTNTGKAHVARCNVWSFSATIASATTTPPPHPPNPPLPNNTSNKP